ncbi:hypothetical protein BGZ93_006579 [Podila epicladia]|nr:hypothetical protein BGZ93_006579 [Podila epicladia]
MSWDCDHIFSPLFDFTASFLDMATKQYPSTLTLLDLDTSQLSCTGLVSLQKILDRSHMEDIHFLCTPFNPAMSESIATVCGSVQWLTLKSLVLSGSHINEWIKLLPLSCQSPELMRLLIQGTGQQSRSSRI